MLRKLWSELNPVKQRKLQARSLQRHTPWRGTPQSSRRHLKRESGIGNHGVAMAATKPLIDICDAPASSSICWLARPLPAMVEAASGGSDSDDSAVCCELMKSRASCEEVIMMDAQSIFSSAEVVNWESCASSSTMFTSELCPEVPSDC
mmetsp:Transcript_42785/g.112562  ORF Transcript_42785/g.112562 Transcript_42785/m.112562 type:complete len:149 (+) Transcript_42785:139-585(+)